MTVNYDIQNVNSWGSGTPVRSYVTGVTNSGGTVMLSGDLSAGNITTNQIDPRELAELKDDSKMLYALIDAGVENWSGYHEALANYRETT